MKGRYGVQGVGGESNPIELQFTLYWMTPLAAVSTPQLMTFFEGMTVRKMSEGHRFKPTGFLFLDIKVDFNRGISYDDAKSIASNGILKFDADVRNIITAPLSKTGPQESFDTGLLRRGVPIDLDATLYVSLEFVKQPEITKDAEVTVFLIGARDRTSL